MYRSVYTREKSTAECNLTPLIDVTFQLIIFFILAGAFASMDKISLDVPTLASTNRLDDLKLPYKVVVQVLPQRGGADEVSEPTVGRAALWQIGPIRIPAGDTVMLTTELSRARANFARRRAGDPALADAAKFQVEVRADRSVLYSDVRKVLAAINAAGFERVHYVAVGSEAQ